MFCHARSRFRQWARIFAAGLGGVACLGALQAEPDRDLGLPFFDVFDPRDYRGHTQVWSTVEDAAGLTYFGNYGGVLVHDGTRWERIDVPGTSFVRALALDATDTLWIGAVNELGYARTDPAGRRAFVSLKEKLPPDARACGELWRVVLTPHGPLFQSNTWLLRWDGTAFATLALAQPGSWQAVAAGDTVWITQGQRGWFNLQDDGTTLALAPRERPAALAGATLTFALPTASPGVFLFGTPRAGLLRWDGRDFTAFPTTADEWLKSQRLYRGTRLADGRLLLTTLQAGAFLLDAQGSLLARLDESAGLPDNTVLSAFAGRHAQVWLGMERGVVRVDARPWLTWFGQARGVPHANLGAPLPYRDEHYVASNTGLYRLAPADATAPARLVAVPGFRDYLSGITIADDTLIGYGEQGLFEWRGGERQPLPGDGANAYGFGASRTQPHRWFALVDGGVFTYRREAGAWRAEGRIPQLDHVRSALEEDDGTWWFGTPSDGLLRVTFPHASAAGPGEPLVTRFGTAAGLPASHGWLRAIAAGGRPLILCERGFFRFDRQTQRFSPTAEYGKSFADGTRTARTLTADSRGGLWIATRDAGEAELVTPIELGLADAAGWHPLRVPQLPRLDDVTELRVDPERDQLWISGHGGLVRIDLAGWRAAAAEPPPSVVVRRVETPAGDRLPVTGGWQLPYRQRSVRVFLAAPALAGDPGILFESTLLGATTPIIVADPAPQRSFPALAAGAYTLRLRTRGGDGRWGAPLELAFTVLPPWWFSGWAWTAYTLLGAAAIAGLVRSQTRLHRRRAERLEAVVAARTEELRRSHVELVRLHQLELDEKAAVKLSEEKARLELLRYQLNPHFLLNAFTTLRSLVFNRPDAAGDMVARLADFCRLALTRSDETGGTVADEVKLIETYLATEQARWRDELVSNITCDPAVAEVRLPPFLLQPLVENAVKYGGRTSPGTLELRVTIASDGAQGLRIEVANTGAWVAADGPPRPDSTGIGLDNLRQRLRRYYPDAHQLDLQVENGWVRVVLTLHCPARDPFAPTRAAH